MTNYPKIILKPGKEQSPLRFHPWVFSGAIRELPSGLEEGDIVSVNAASGQFLGIGHYQIGSIAIRIFAFQEEEITEEFWFSKISAAWQIRSKTVLSVQADTNVFRLIHAEGDGMPGLVVDIYSDVAVLQAHSVGMYRNRHEIANAIQQVLGNKIVAVYDKSAKTVPFKANLNPEDGFLLGSAPVVREVMEYGLRFNVDFANGQKTGFFIDQRENRHLVEQMAHGRKVLNLFCYTGGFSFAALRGGARLVHSVDSSASAMELTRQNIELNFPHSDLHEAFTKDVSSFIKEMQNDYDLIILDPPAFAKHRDALSQALNGYRRINLRALQKIEKGGLLFTFSCSQIVSRDAFRDTILTAAIQAGRKISILHQMSQPADHPVNIFHPEGEYLKGLVLYVE